jgi:hypothetical protein
MTRGEKICKALNIDYNQILNIYKYGSVVYSCNDEYSDEDYIIVYKSALTPSGSFKDNAISSYNHQIQAVCYYRGGFIYDINNFEKHHHGKIQELAFHRRCNVRDGGDTHSDTTGVFIRKHIARLRPLYPK